MASAEHALDVYLNKNIIATIRLQGDQLHWQYQPAWQQTGFAVSPHLPLHKPIPTLNVQRFLRNLLPESHGLEALLTTFHLSRDNTFGLIRNLGLDIAGALVVLPHGQSYPYNAGFRLIPHHELAQRLNNRDTFNLTIWDGKPRLSVAGVQDKINVVVNDDNQIGFGEGNLCSTHILKFETKKLSHLVLNEYFSMQLAKQCGLNVADVKLVHFETHPSLLVQRFDRFISTRDKVTRRQIIDGCQALNLPPEYKYERNFGSNRDVAHIREGATFKKLFNFANQCDNPIVTKQQILDWALFNVLIFNYDAHGKNISFFVGHNGLTLTPFYDLVNIHMYPHFDHEIAMALGDEFDSQNINAYQLADFADSCGLARLLVARRLTNLATTLLTALVPVGEKISANDQELEYLAIYQQAVSKRCQHLLTQAKQIVNIDL